MAFNLDQRLEEIGNEFNLGTKDIKAKYEAAKEKLIQDKVTIPYVVNGISYGLEELAANSLYSGLKGSAKPEVKFLVYLKSQSPKMETSGENKKPYKIMYMLVQVGGNKLFLPTGSVKNGFAYLEPRLWSTDIYEKGFYTATLKKSQKGYSVLEIVPTEQTFDLAAATEADPLAFFKVLSRGKKFDQAKKAGGSFEKQKMSLLVEYASGKKMVISASTTNHAWFDVTGDGDVVYQGVIQESGGYYNIRTPPIPSDHQITLDDVENVKYVSEYSDMESFLDERGYAKVICVPALGNTKIVQKENDGGVYAFATFMDFCNPPNELHTACFDMKILAPIVDKTGTLAPVCRVLVDLQKKDKGLNMNVQAAEKAPGGFSSIEEATPAPTQETETVAETGDGDTW